MTRKKNESASKLNRRRFLNLSGLAAAGFGTSSLWAAEKNANDDPFTPIMVNEYGKQFPVESGNDIAEILETKVICKEKGKYMGVGSEYGFDDNGHPIIIKKVMEEDRYLGWPTIAKTATGELLVAFSGDRDSHVCPWGKTQLIRSNDQGKTWSDPETVNNTPLDDRDGGIIMTKKGTILVSWFTSTAFMSATYFQGAILRYMRHGEKLTKEVRDKWLGNWTRRSEDNGKTWDQPIPTISTAPHGPIQLKDGRLLYIGNGILNGKPTNTIEESSDDGRSWKVIADFPKPEGYVGGLGEPHMVELASGKIIALFRNEPKDRSKCFLLQADSNDGGRTWSPLRSTGIWGYPPHLIQLKNGWVLVVYGHRQQPFGQKACISRDEGKTWDTANQVFLSAGPGSDLGYPSSVELNDGSIFTVYYQPEKKGEPTSIMSTHWRLK